MTVEDVLHSYPQAAANSLVPDLPALMACHPELAEVVRIFFAGSGTLPCFP
jgi:hypothetical protein